MTCRNSSGLLRIRGSGLSFGQVVGWVASLADLTEFHQLRARVARVETLAAAGNLASSLAHEINNPLNAVINCLAMHRKFRLDSTVRVLCNSYT